MFYKQKRNRPTRFSIYNFGRWNPSVRLNENVVSRVHGDEKFKISISKISETTHTISIILDVLETKTKSADTFFDLYDFGRRNPSVHLIQDLVSERKIFNEFPDSPPFAQLELICITSQLFDA